MADKSTSLSQISDQRVLPHTDAETAFEQAYFTNSYPQETPKIKSIQTCIKVLVFIAVFIEFGSTLGLVGSMVKYSQLVTKVDGVIHLGTLATIISSAAKIISSIHAHTYASKRTDRTPEKRESTAKFMRLVTIVCGLVMICVIHMLNVHAVKTVDTLRASYSENDFQGSHDFLTRITDSVSSVQMTLFTTFVFHLLIHFMTHRLDKVERNMPRVVDLSAANSAPKKDE